MPDVPPDQWYLDPPPDFADWGNDEVPVSADDLGPEDRAEFDRLQAEDRRRNALPPREQ